MFIFLYNRFSWIWITHKAIYVLEHCYSLNTLCLFPACLIPAKICFISRKQRVAMLCQVLPLTVIISRYIKEKVIIPPAVYLKLIKQVPEYNSRGSSTSLMSLDMKHKLEISGLQRWAWYLFTFDYSIRLGSSSVQIPALTGVITAALWNSCLFYEGV